MYMQNVKHTGWSNNNIQSVIKNPVADWIFTCSNNIQSSACIGSDGTIYVGSIDEKLYAITKDGNLKWSFNVGSEIRSSPVIGSDGTIYIGGDGGDLYAIKNGIEKWCFNTFSRFRSSPAIDSDGTVYIGNWDDRLYAITNGQTKWSYLTSNTINQSSPSIGIDGTIYIGNWDGRLYAITNGQLKWSYWTGSLMDSSPTIDSDNTVYVGCDNGYLYAITNGQTKWSYDTGDWIRTSPAIGDDGTIYIGGYNCTLFALSSNGVFKWSYSASTGAFSSPVIGSDNTIYVGCSDGSVYAITNGGLLWKYKTSGSSSIVSPAIGPDGSIYFGNTDDKLYAIKQNNRPELQWCGTPGYITNGVEPDKNKKGQLFTFKIMYKDIDNDNPITNQVWIDTNDNSIFEDNEKYNLIEASGSNYSNGVFYSNSFIIYYSGDGIINYKYYFTDRHGYYMSSCSPNTNHSFLVTTNIPSLNWTGEAGYISDGVSPNTNDSGMNFQFRINYLHLDNYSPVSNQVWIDINDNSIYEMVERFNMIEVNGLDENYADGKLYYLNKIVNYKWDGELNYRFYFKDNFDKAVGNPTNNNTFFINHIPILEWIGTNGWISDGINPNTNYALNEFEFRIRFYNPSNNAPTTNQVWIDLDDDGIYNNTNERIDMLEVDVGDTIYSNGKDYTKSVALHYLGDGDIKYKFYFKTSFGIITGDPTNNSYMTVLNNSPLLEWYGLGSYVDKGVDKNSYTSRETCVFKIKYNDRDNHFPTIKQVWIDLNDNGLYSNDEKIDMTEIQSSDTIYSNGKTYKKELDIVYKGDGSINYRFYFFDGISEAIGLPTQNQILIINKNAEETLVNVIAGPIPFKISRDKNFRFEKLTADATIKIYSILGELICTLQETDNDGKQEWDLKDKNGNIVNQGVYICEITNTKGERKFIKIALSK